MGSLITQEDHWTQLTTLTTLTLIVGPFLMSAHSHIEVLKACDPSANGLVSSLSAWSSTCQRGTCFGYTLVDGRPIGNPQVCGIDYKTNVDNSKLLTVRSVP